MNDPGARRLLLKQFEHGGEHVGIFDAHPGDLEGRLALEICGLGVGFVDLDELLHCFQLLVLDSQHQGRVAQPPSLLVLGCHARPVTHLVEDLLELDVCATCCAVPHCMEHLCVLALLVEHLRCFVFGVSCISQCFRVSVNLDKFLHQLLIFCQYSMVQYVLAS